MLYEDYLVTSHGLEEVDRPLLLPKFRKQQRYVCEMTDWNGHTIGISLALDQCVGAPENVKIYNLISPHIETGKFLHCEFALRWHHDHFLLCLSGFIKARAINGSGQEMKIPPGEFLKNRRRYLVAVRIYGDWIRFPGLIDLGGESKLPVKFDGEAWPSFVSDHKDQSKGVLVWKKKKSSIFNIFNR